MKTSSFLTAFLFRTVHVNTFSYREILQMWNPLRRVQERKVVAAFVNFLYESNQNVYDKLDHFEARCMLLWLQQDIRTAKNFAEKINDGSICYILCSWSIKQLKFGFTAVSDSGRENMARTFLEFLSDNQISVSVNTPTVSLLNKY